MKNYLILFVVLFVAFLSSCQQTTTVIELQNWQWRGDNRDGIFNEIGLLKEWPVGGPQLLWYFEGLGEGHSSPAIANGKVYATGMHEGKLILYVFDMTGHLLVEKEIGMEWNENWNGTRSSVCINEGKLYILNAFGNLYCLDETTLEPILVKDLIDDFDGVNLMFGITESPLIVGDKLFMHPGGEVHNFIALDKNTGALIWSSPGEGTMSAYCSPQYIGGYSVPIVVTSSHEHIIAVNADTGEKLWSYPQKTQFGVHANTPLYSDGLIFSSAGGGGGSVMLRLKDGGRDVELAWKNDSLDNQMGGAVKIGDYIYASGQNNRFWFCVDWKTGETMYQIRNLAPCAVIYADGMLYCYSDNGNMSLVKPDPANFELVSRFEITLGTDQHWAHPVIYDGVLYIRHGDALMAYKVK